MKCFRLAIAALLLLMMAGAASAETTTYGDGWKQVCYDDGRCAKTIGVTTYQTHNGSYVPTPISQINPVPLGYDILWNGGRLHTRWDGTYAFDMIVNPDTDQTVSYWDFWHVESYRTTGQGSWQEEIPVSNTFVKIDNSTLKRMMTLDSGGKFNITYRVQGTKLKADLEITAGYNRQYRFVHRTDTIPSNFSLNNQSKKFDAGFFNGLLIYDWSDVQPYTTDENGTYVGGYNTTQWVDQNAHKFYQQIEGVKKLNVSEKWIVDPSWTVGSGGNAWSGNSSFDNVTLTGDNDNNVVVGNFADFFMRPDSTDLGTSWNETGTSTQIYNNRVNFTYFATSGAIEQNHSGGDQFIRFKYHDSNTGTTGARVRIYLYMSNTSLNGGGYYLQLFEQSSLSPALSYSNGTSIDITVSGGSVVYMNDSTDVYLTINSSEVGIYYDDSYRGKLDFGSTYTYSSGYFGVGGSTGITTTQALSQFRIYNSTSGNLTTWHDALINNETYQIDVNATGNYSISYNNNDSGMPNVELGNFTAASFDTWNNRSITIAPNTKYQDTIINATLFGNTTATSTLYAITFFTQAASGGSSGAIPPNPTTLANTTGNFYVNHTWAAGAGNVTNSFNVSQNGTWTNGSANTFKNATVGAHGWSNITVWAFNSSGNGNLSAGSASQNTQIPNNAPVQAAIGAKTVDENQWLNFTISTTDADSDSITYQTNATKGTLTTNSFSWKPTYSDSGTYLWEFNSSDGYGGIDTEIITVTVTNIPLSVTSSLPASDPTTTQGTAQEFSVTMNRTANVTWYMNGSLMQTNSSVTTATYTNSTAPVNASWNVTASITDGTDSTSRRWNWTINAAAPGTYIPPTPTTPANTSGNFWINSTWQAGAGNITNSYNVSFNNGSWLNTSANTYINNTLAAHGHQNLTIYAFNNSGGGTLSASALSFNVTIPNNAPTLSNTTNQSVNEGAVIYIDIDGSDADTDTLTFSNNQTNFTDFSTSTGKGNWTTNYSSAGTYFVDIGVSDGYGGQANYTMNITINNVPLNTTASLPASDPTTTEGAAQVFNITLNRAGNVAWLMNGTQMQYNASVTIANYTNSTAGVLASWNVTASVNETGTADTSSRMWNWTVSATPTPTPTPTPTAAPVGQLYIITNN